MEPKNKIFIYLLVIFFAVFVGTGLFVGMGNKNNQQSQMESSQDSTATVKEDVATLKQENLVMPTVAPTEGSLSLTTKTDSYTVSDTVTVDLAGQSQGKNIVGYDVIIYYDPLSFEFVEVKSSLSDFKIYSYNRGNYLLLTAVKSLDSQAPTVLGTADKSQPMASVSFKPKKPGKFNFSLRQSAGQDVTDLVTDQTEVLIPTLTDLSVEIK